MYGPLLDRRNLLLVDQRGTGRSEPIDCPALQDLERSTTPTAAAACGGSSGDRADLYTTRCSADDLAAVDRGARLGPVDLYGDSYGTFFAQVFAGRHPSCCAASCSTAPTRRTARAAWYPTQGPAMRDAFDVVCQRSPACRDGRRPFHARPLQPGARAGAAHTRGAARAYDADGVAGCRSTSTALALVQSRSTRRTAPAFYRELTAALRSGAAPATARRCCGWSRRPPAAAPTRGAASTTARASTPP